MKYLKPILKLSLLIIFYVISFLYAIIFTNQTGWILFWFLSLILLLEILSLITPLRLLQVRSPKPLRLAVDEFVTIELLINSLYKMPLYFHRLNVSFSEIRHTKQLSNYLWQEKKLKVAWQPINRGLIESQNVLFETHDFLHCFPRTIQMTMPVEWVVLPLRHSFVDQGIAIIEHLMSKKAYGEPTFTLKNYRQYREGESIKQIDWKTSSRMQTLMTREYENDEPSKWLLVFYGIESIYFEEMLSLFYTIFLEYPTQARFMLMGEGTTSYQIESLVDFASVQPLNDLPMIPYRENENICIFVPKVTDELATLFQAKRFHLIPYEQVMSGGEPKDVL